MPRGGDEERGQMPRPRDRCLLTLLLISELNGQMFNILMQRYYRLIDNSTCKLIRIICIYLYFLAVC